MRFASISFLIPVLTFAQTPAQNLAARGLDVFNKTCATGYCHGTKGTAGGAPRLAARGFDEAYITQTIRLGIPGTGMPAFGNLERNDLLAVVAYVDSLNGITPAANPGFAAGPARPKLSPDAQRGRELFSDQVRGMTRCSNCHQADGLGIAVTLPFQSFPEIVSERGPGINQLSANEALLPAVPDSIAALRQIATPHVEIATAEGDTFPALVLNRNGAQTKLYDLTVPPPVLRTFTKGVVTFKAGSSWNHSSMLKPYSDAELESILTFLRAVTK